MRAIPLMTPRPGTGRALPTPTVRSMVVRQAVDLRPAGNTIAIRTVSDNPFEDSRSVSVVTQASGGMSSAPASMTSKGILHSMLPGLGETATAEVTKDQGAVNQALTFLTSATEDVTGAIAQRYGARAAAAEAQARQAEAQASQARSQADLAMAKMRQGVMATSADIGGVKVNIPLILLGVGLLGGAYFLSKRSK
jgi:hypothetical protein